MGTSSNNTVNISVFSRIDRKNIGLITGIIIRLIMQSNKTSWANSNQVRSGMTRPVFLVHQVCPGRWKLPVGLVVNVLVALVLGYIVLRVSTEISRIIFFFSQKFLFKTSPALFGHPVQKYIYIFLPKYGKPYLK